MIAIINADENLNDFLIRYWDYHRDRKERSFLLWSIDMSSSWFSSKNDDSSNDVEDLIFDSSTVQMFDMMFSWWSKFDLMT